MKLLNNYIKSNKYILYDPPLNLIRYNHRKDFYNNFFWNEISLQFHHVNGRSLHEHCLIQLCKILEPTLGSGSFWN